MLNLEGSVEEAYAKAQDIARNGFDTRKKKIAYYHHGWRRWDIAMIYPIGKGKVSIPVNREEEGLYFVKNLEVRRVEAVSLSDISESRTKILWVSFINFLLYT